MRLREFVGIGSINKCKIYANKRRELYKNRHKSDRKVQNSAGFYADRILW